MNGKQVGDLAEVEAMGVLKEHGFVNIYREGLKDPYDLIAEKNGEKFFIEVKSRKIKNRSANIIMSPRQFEGLECRDPVLFLVFINNRYAFFTFDEVREVTHKHQNAKNKNEFSYCFNVKLEGSSLTVAEMQECKTCLGKVKDMKRKKRGSKQ